MDLIVQRHTSYLNRGKKLTEHVDCFYDRVSLASCFDKVCVRFYIHRSLHFSQKINFAQRMRHFWTPLFVKIFLCFALHCSVAVTNTVLLCHCDSFRMGCLS